jgi:hypothetical protein
MAGFSLPTVGQPNSTEDAKVLTILTGVNDIAARYRTLLTLPASIASQGVATYTFQPSGLALATGGATTSIIVPFELLAADHAVTGLSTKLRVKMVVSVGSTSPGTSVVTAGLYPLTIAAGNWTLGTVTSGSTAASSALATNTATVAAGVQATLQLQARNV